MGLVHCEICTDIRYDWHDDGGPIYQEDYAGEQLGPHMNMKTIFQSMDIPIEMPPTQSDHILHGSKVSTVSKLTVVRA